MSTQNADKNIEVLIVGAGPSGLMMASQLALHKIHFRIIDKKEYPSSYSGALIVHARSVEIFNQLGIAEKVLQEGILANKIRIIGNGKESIQLTVKNIGRGLTKFPNLHLLEQSKTEQLLIDFIAEHEYAVERKTELLSFTQYSDAVTCILKLVNGEEETIQTKYLIAADGGNSLVRKQLNIPFIGKTHPVSLFITDCKAEVDFPSDEMCFSFSNETTSGFFPLPEGRCRVDGVIPEELAAKDKIIFNDIEKTFAEKNRMNVRLVDPEWFSVFRSHQYYASSYQQNCCFLVGDAAHIFTPVGAQGMNTGLQDAYNLAWKLAFVIQGKAKTTLLNTYTEERKNIAKKLVRTTGKIYNVLTSQNFFMKKIRVYLLPHLMKCGLPLIEKQKIVREYCFNTISEIGIHYRKSSLSKHASLGHFPHHAPKPGDRVPYLLFNNSGKEINIQEKVKGGYFQLFIFNKDTSSLGAIAIAEKYKEIIIIEIIPYSSETKMLYEQFGIKDNGYYLVRPDSHVAFRSNKPETVFFEKYLQQFLN